MKFRIFVSLLLVLSLFAVTANAADTLYKPFVLASVNDGTLEENTEATVKALKGAGFEIAGQYAPIEGTNIIVATNDAMKVFAGRTD